MTRQLYSERFPKYAEAFEWAWERYQKGEKPTWHHWWLQRYLQISPSYYEYTLINAKRKRFQMKTGCSFEEAELEIGIGRLKSREHYNQIKKIYFSFGGDIWKINFAMWWYIRARYQFSVHVLKNPEIKEIFYLPTNKLPSTQELDLYRNNFFSYENEIVGTRGYPSAALIGIPIRSTKKKTMKLIEDYLDEHINFSKPGIPVGNYSMHKSKLREKTVEDCYKVLELRSYQNEPNLIFLALETNCLPGTIAGYKNSIDPAHQLQCLNSLRAATSRQLKHALYIAENAALGIFPSNKKPEHFIEFDFDRLNKIYKKLLRENNFNNNIKEEWLKVSMTDISDLEENQDLHLTMRFLD